MTNSQTIKQLLMSDEFLDAVAERLAKKILDQPVPSEISDWASKLKIDFASGESGSYISDCLHDQCPQCSGFGVRRDGLPCIHNISCSCGKCRLS